MTKSLLQVKTATTGIRKNDADPAMSPGAKPHTPLRNPVVKKTWCTLCNSQMLRAQDMIIRHLKTQHKMPPDDSLIAAIMDNTDRGTTPEKSESPALQSTPKDSRLNAKLLAVLLDVEVFPFIDKAQFVRSLVFWEMVEKATYFAIKDENFTPAKNILTRFAKTRYFKPIACFLADRAALRINVKNREIIVHQSKETKAQGKTLTAYLDEYKKNNMDAFGQKEGKAEKYIDIMDTPMLLPGSFGSGKKR